ncbi:DUF2937 family protein [Xinfangfangia sp. CPCC 101601]|uniref:DUF2937 family protein n=1 Tax=Pseudogemmobacter lacusdianii TaxID=3069608 RepID=A0ABU0VTC2_9RHOB|nr:DUF2937 family protein [Xinfangfangia sp. CPCC 101601]MDQ2064961.1 DUF2937 family protein [Xinfangfangia sp. CPCC 101601]
MFGRMLTLAGGLAGAVGLSQFPEFSQQYLQRLAGQVDALTQVEADFDRSAEGAGLTREEALLALGTDGFAGQHARDLRATFSRAESLRNDLTMLRLAGVFERLAMPQRMADQDLLQATWQDFAPAVPVTTAGLGCAGLGFLSGWGLIAALLALMKRPFRRRAYSYD